MISKDFFRYFTEEQLVKRFALAVNLILGFLISYQLATLIGFVAEEDETALPKRGPSQAQIAVPKSDTVTLTAFEQLHLFGEARATKRQESVAQASRVRPTLTLRGIIHSTNSRAARAIITEANGRDVAYPVGARLPGGIRLTKINHRNVVLLHRGREELLHLSNKGAGS